MAAIAGSFLLAFLLSAAFVDEVNFNVTSIDRLVNYKYDFDFDGIIPGLPYGGAIVASWAVPDSSLPSNGEKTIKIKIIGDAGENSSAYFLSEFGEKSRYVEAFLVCRSKDGVCSEGSVLQKEIPVYVSAEATNFDDVSNIRLTSEIYYSDSLVEIDGPAASLIDSIKAAFSFNGTNNTSSDSNRTSDSGQDGFSVSHAENDFIGSLSPEDNSAGPLSFLRENPVISIVALAIVVIVTGSFLLGSKD